MKMIAMLLLLLVMVGWSQGMEEAVECSDSEMQEIQSQFNQCAVQLEYTFEERKGDSKDATDDEVGVALFIIKSLFHHAEHVFQTAGCTLVTGTVVECGKAWAKCYTEEEVGGGHNYT